MPVAVPCLKAQNNTQAAVVSEVQPFDATGLRAPAEIGKAGLVQAGDDPAYARKDFDDAQWSRFDASTSVNTIFSKRLPQVFWYRLHVKVAPAETGLALALYQISSAFEVYVNGQRVAQNGQISPFKPYTTKARLLERIPDGLVSTGSLVIALRVRPSSIEWGDPKYRLFAREITLGQEQTQWEHIWLKAVGENALEWSTELIGLGLGIVALALFSAGRREREYLWIFLRYLSVACVLPLAFTETFRNVPINWELILQAAVIAGFLFSAFMYFAFLRIRPPRWVRVLITLAIAGEILSLILQSQGAYGTIWMIGFGVAVPALLFFLLLVNGVIPVLLLVHLRRGSWEAGVLLIPAILSSSAIYLSILTGMLDAISGPTTEEKWLHKLVVGFPAGPFVLSLSHFCDLLSLLSLAIIMVLRATRATRQQALLEGEIAAARAVQQVILPEAGETAPGFTIESVYQPAQQVGGDFYQILPAGEGGLLVVVGDVAGKGLPAAMLVSVLVGAIRMVADYTCDPVVVLAGLNQRLLGRTHGGFSTALAAHIAADGRVTIANAGHLSPYIDGTEIELLGALPLGVVSGAAYETSQFHLPRGSRLTFYSDGVVEAQNQKGELFGFDRARLISTQPAAAIFEAAKLFGQADDITVVTIERLAAVDQPAATGTAPMLAPA